jgi:hypothetical protein
MVTIPVLDLEQLHFLLAGYDEGEIMTKNTHKESDHNYG